MCISIFGTSGLINKTHRMRRVITDRMLWWSGLFIRMLCNGPFRFTTYREISGFSSPACREQRVNGVMYHQHITTKYNHNAWTEHFMFICWLIQCSRLILKSRFKSYRPHFCPSRCLCGLHFHVSMRYLGIMVCSTRWVRWPCQHGQLHPGH